MTPDEVEARINAIAEECNSFDIAGCAKHGPELEALLREKDD